MAGRQVSRNNVIAGAFLVVSLALAIGASVIVSGAQERLIPTREYVVRFSLAEGAAGLRPGSRVTLGGLAVGRVSDLSIAATPGEPSLDARVRIRTGVTLYENALVFLERPLLGSGSEINITSVGAHRDGAPYAGASDRLEPGEAVPGHIAPPSFLAQAGYGADQAEKVRAVINQLSDVSDRMDRMVTHIEPQINPTVDAARAAVDDIRQVAADLREKDRDWWDRIDHILTSADDAATKAGPLVDDAHRVVSGVQSAIDENRPRVDGILASARSAAAKVDTQTIDRLNTALASADAGLNRAGSVIGDFSKFLAEQMPTLRRMVGNFRLASDQLKLVAIEVRRNPWRLLYRPETKELEAEMLYDSARSYAEAVSDLRAASEALQAAAATPDAALTVADRQSLEGLHQQIVEAFQKYQDAERAFLERAEEKAR